MTEQQILEVASYKIFVVRRYLSSHRLLREVCRRLVSEKKLVLINAEGDTEQYVTPSALQSIAATTKIL